METSAFVIGELAKKTDTSVETIRFYEKSGLLPAPARTSNNYRSYDMKHLKRLAFIRKARNLGFSLDQIRAMLTMSDDSSQSCEAVDELARQHLKEIVSKIKDLTSLKLELDRMITQCTHGTINECRIIEALSG